MEEEASDVRNWGFMRVAAEGGGGGGGGGVEAASGDVGVVSVAIVRRNCGARCWRVRLRTAFQLLSGRRADWVIIVSI